MKSLLTLNIFVQSKHVITQCLCEKKANTRTHTHMNAHTRTRSYTLWK